MRRKWPIKKTKEGIRSKKETTMQNKHDDQILDNLAELSDTEIEELLGAGWGVVPTISHECHMNTWQWFFTCCS